MTEAAGTRARILELSNAYKSKPSIDGLIAVADCLPELRDDPVAFFELASALARQVFYYGQYFPKPARDKLYYDKLGASYVQAVRGWSQALAGSMTEQPRAKSDGNVIWIVTAQFLAPMHAPTKRVLRLAEKLKGDGFEVRIINANGLAYQITVNALDTYILQRRQGKPGWTSFKYNDKRWPLWTPSNDDLGPEKFREMASIFLADPPRAVFHVGDMNVVADLTTAFAPSIFIPTVFRQPISMADAMMERYPVGPWRQIADVPEPVRVPGRLELLEEPYHDPVTRADLGIPDDAKLIVLPGMRLEQEVAPVFERGLSIIMSAMPRAWLLICGWNRPYPFKSAHLTPFQDRIVRLHNRTDIKQIIANCDLLLDPPGLGGGGCARYAMEQGVQALAIDGGDSAAILGPDHTVKDFNQLVETAFGWLSGKTPPPAYRAELEPPLLDTHAIIGAAEGRFRG